MNRLRVIHESSYDDHKRRSDKRTCADTMQNLAELRLKPGTLERYGSMLRVELMIISIAYALHRWGGH